MTAILKKLNSLNLPPETMVSLSFEEGCDVFVHNESEVETALSQTDVVATLASLLSTPGVKVYSNWGSELLEEMRSQDLLEDYERGSFGFEEYLAETITDNFYDLEMVDYSIEKYDYKRGFCTLSARVQIPLANLLEHAPYIGCWTTKVSTENGTLTLD